ncbi:MAG: mannosyl-glycoprotein endo-beta-N-acetylglucosamidase [Nitrospirae bacterium]|nr:MAG: mannosyl-glycoprotein endo-beta-N-acetylglucosamidase [Nitrospirota bacterium]
MNRFILILTVSATLAIFFVSSLELAKLNSPEQPQPEYVVLTDPAELLNEDFNCSSIRPVIYKRVVSLSALSAEQRKEAFVRLMLPSILLAQEEIKRERERVLKLKEKVDRGFELSNDEYTYLSSLFSKYKTSSIDILLRRLNTHPVSIILAQAALESGWGTSRFFVQGNNVFGIWTFKKDRGLKAVSSEARVSTYPSLLDAVRDYLFNINVGWAYRGFRIKRTSSEEPLKLINYLENYSELRSEYVNRLNHIIRSNHLERFDSCRLDPRYSY